MLICYGENQDMLIFQGTDKLVRESQHKTPPTIFSHTLPNPRDTEEYGL